MPTLQDFSAIRGDSNAIHEVLRVITTVAPGDGTVLLFGESGTGKELAAREIHKQSPRRDRPFLAVNCATFTETLLESELFGHEKGAFTGAHEQKKGLFERAHRSTLFLDEIGDTSLAMQAKLLRALEEREITRVGGTESIKVDVRIIAATNRNLKQMLKEGTFREDLYYRLHVLPINLPPLRERKEDIPLLLDHFLKKYEEKNGREGLHFGDSAIKRLMDYDWPGNVRELQNVIEQAVHAGGPTDNVLVAPPLNDTEQQIKDLGRSLDGRQRQIFDIATQCSFNSVDTAKQMNDRGLLRGVSKQAFSKMLNKRENQKLRNALIEAKQLLKGTSSARDPARREASSPVCTELAAPIPKSGEAGKDGRFTPQLRPWAAAALLLLILVAIFPRSAWKRSRDFADFFILLPYSWNALSSRRLQYNPETAQVTKALSEYVEDEFAESRRGNPDGRHDAWTEAQMRVALDGAVTRMDDQGLLEWLQGQMGSCSCWRQHPKSSVDHIGVTGWVLLAFSRMNHTPSESQIEFILSNQHAAGWWPQYPSKDTEDYASTYATAMSTWALAGC